MSFASRKLRRAFVLCTLLPRPLSLCTRDILKTEGLHQTRQKRNDELTCVSDAALSHNTSSSRPVCSREKRMEEDLVRLSKTISYALRHNPQGYGLQLDSEGWVPIEELLNALRQQRGAWRRINVADIETMMARSEKQRFEIHAGKIRAFYGHSTARIEKQPAIPPEFLYHGTTPRATDAIRREGLKPMQRQYVHLSTSEQTARSVALRRTTQPVLLRVAALEAHRCQGVRFYPGNQDIWLADAIPPAFLDVLQV